MGLLVIKDTAMTYISYMHAWESANFNLLVASKIIQSIILFLKFDFETPIKGELQDCGKRIVIFWTYT